MSIAAMLSGLRSDPKQITASNVRRWIDLLVSLIIITIGLLTALFAVRLVVRSYTPAYFWDQWDILRPLIETNDHPGLSQLWAQHNEHRIVIQRLLSFADLRWFRGKSISLLAETQIVQLVHVLVLVYFCKRLGKLSPSALASISGILIFALFSPLQMPNFESGFQTAFVLVGLFASVSLGLMVLQKFYPDNGRIGKLLFAGSIVSAILCELSIANGVLLWPILFLAGLLARISRSKLIGVATVGLCAIAIYMIGYKTPSYHSSPLQALRTPGKLLRYVLTCFGYSWDTHLPSHSPWPSIAESATFLAMCFVLCLLVHLWRTRLRPAFLLILLATNSLFCMATAVITASGRIRFGYEQATAGRYQSFALIFWACIAITGLTLLAKQSWSIRIAANLTILIVLISTPTRWREITDASVNRKTTLDQAWSTLMVGDVTEQSAKLLSPEWDRMPSYYRYLVTHHIIPAPLPNFKNLQKQIGRNWCSGFVDSSVIGPGDVIVTSGWAYNRLTRMGAAKVLLVGSDDEVVGSAQMGLPRTDVTAADKSISYEATGWTITWYPSHSGIYKAYALVTDHSVCPLNGDARVP